MSNLEEVRQRVESDARSNGYYLNPNYDFLQDLLQGLLRNQERYGYPSCPCRLASGEFDLDRDIVCPCDYRDYDVMEYGCCYCALFVRKDLFEGKTSIRPIPERRPPDKQLRAKTGSSGLPSVTVSSKTEERREERKTAVKTRLWYCRQCGYVCFREEPPLICPICKAKKEMFAELSLSTRAES